MKEDNKALIVIFSVFGILIAIIVWAVYGIWYTNYAMPAEEYCSKTIPIIYVNQTALTDNDKCFNYLLDNDYDLIGKNGSYYILEPKK